MTTTRARCLAAWLSAATLLPACASRGGDEGEGEGDVIVDTGDDDPNTCEPGRFGCTCNDGNSCVTGLECVDGVCELLDEAAETGDTPPSACGWNRGAQWYDCGFVGSDPSGEFPRLCPAGLAAGTPCPPALPFEGCCDGDGNVWYCDEGRVINTSC